MGSPPPGKKHSSLDKVLDRLDQLDRASLHTLVQRLARERTLLESVFHTLQEGVLVIDGEGGIEYANAAASRLVGLKEPAVGSTLWRFVPGLRGSLDLSGSAAAAPVVTREFALAYPTPRVVRLYLVPFREDAQAGPRFALILSDITREKQSTAELIENEKISSILLLAAGVAHELGNPLNSLTIHLQLIERRLRRLKESKETRALEDSIKVCQDEVTRLDGIIKNFLEAIRPRPPDLADVNVVEVIGDVLRFQGRELADRGLKVEAELPAGTPVAHYPGCLISPGFIDTHVHYTQTGMIGAYGAQLLDWLNRYAYPAEMRFSDRAYAATMARAFCDELVRNGTTTALVFGTVHAQSVDAFFKVAMRRGLRMVAGKAMMDRHCPDFLRDTAQSSYDDSKRLIEAWHGAGRLGYALTPRFAITSSEAQMEAAGALAKEHPTLSVHTHVAENQAEVAWVKELFPWSRSYLDVYDRYGLLRPHSVYAHCIYLDQHDRRRMQESGAAAAFSPSSNLFLGSGLFDLGEALESGVSVGMATDIGGGTSFSMLRTLAAAYQVAHLKAHVLSAMRAFYLATLSGAMALGLDEALGNFLPGKEAEGRRVCA